MGVEFDEGGDTGSNLVGTPSHAGTITNQSDENQGSGIARLIIKMHLAKTPEGANVAMIIIMILALVLSGVILAFQFGLFNRILPGKNKIQYKEDVPEQVRASLPPGFYDSLPSRPK